MYDNGFDRRARRDAADGPIGHIIVRDGGKQSRGSTRLTVPAFNH
jgi:hypothetical protein